MNSSLRRIEAPHPVVTIVGLLVITALIAISLQTDVSPLVGSSFAIAFIAIFTTMSRWSVRNQRNRHARTLAQARRVPVLPLND
jgi:hypothetical protein